MLDFKNAIVKEAERLISPPNDECKPEGMGTVRFVCQTNGDCREVIEKAKAVLQVVNRHSQGNWPDDEQWTQVLPKEFVAEFGPEMTAEAAEEEMARRRTLSLDQQANSEVELRKGCGKGLRRTMNTNSGRGLTPPGHTLPTAKPLSLEAWSST